jgi:DNA invertase Pin-like site-specific DNA recombinase
MFQMMGVFAEFERAMIRERVLAGIARGATGTSGSQCGPLWGRLQRDLLSSGAEKIQELCIEAIGCLQVWYMAQPRQH